MSACLILGRLCCYSASHYWCQRSLKYILLSSSATFPKSHPPEHKYLARAVATSYLQLVEKAFVLHLLFGLTDISESLKCFYYELYWCCSLCTFGQIVINAIEYIFYLFVTIYICIDLYLYCIIEYIFFKKEFYIYIYLHKESWNWFDRNGN